MQTVLGNPDLAQFLPLAVFVLVMVSVVSLCWLMFANRLSGRTAMLDRLQVSVGNEPAAAKGVGAISEHRRKQSIEKALSEMAQRERAKQRAKLTLKMRLNQADIAWTVVGFYVRVVGASIAAVLIFNIVMNVRFAYAVPLGPIAALIAMNLYVKSQFNARMKKFLEEFPNCIDIITRGVKTGLPLGDCLSAIASEGQEPVKTEFQRIVDDTSVGIPLSQALLRFTHRVPIVEANFFAVVVTIQGQLGGNLSEALGNLSRVLRERKMMKEKIKAFSSEATASGSIIASMPVAVGGILMVTSPDYIGLMFSEFTGNIVLAGCAFWMLTGVLVMRNMIRFDF